MEAQGGKITCAELAESADGKQVTSLTPRLAETDRDLDLDLDSDSNDKIDCCDQSDSVNSSAL